MYKITDFKKDVEAKPKMRKLGSISMNQSI